MPVTGTGHIREEPTMDEPTTTEADAQDPTELVVEQELLVEDVSIDGMCGVY